MGWQYVYEALQNLHCLKLLLSHHALTPDRDCPSFTAVVRRGSLHCAWGLGGTTNPNSNSNSLVVPLPACLLDLSLPVRCWTRPDHVEIRLGLLSLDPALHALQQLSLEDLSLDCDRALPIAEATKPFSVDFDAQALESGEGVQFFCRSCSCQLTNAPFRRVIEVPSLDWREVSEHFYGNCCCASFGAQAELLAARFQQLLTSSEGTCLVASTTCIVHNHDVITSQADHTGVETSHPSRSDNGSPKDELEHQLINTADSDHHGENGAETDHIGVEAYPPGVANGSLKDESEHQSIKTADTPDCGDHHHQNGEKGAASDHIEVEASPPRSASGSLKDESEHQLIKTADTPDCDDHHHQNGEKGAESDHIGVEASPPRSANGAPKNESEHQSIKTADTPDCDDHHHQNGEKGAESDHIGVEASPPRSANGAPKNESEHQSIKTADTPDCDHHHQNGEKGAESGVEASLPGSLKDDHEPHLSKVADTLECDHHHQQGTEEDPCFSSREPATIIEASPESLGNGFMTGPGSRSEVLDFEPFFCRGCSSVVGARRGDSSKNGVHFFKCKISTQKSVSSPSNVFREHTLERLFTHELEKNTESNSSYRYVVRSFQTGAALLQLVLLNQNALISSGMCPITKASNQDVSLKTVAKFMFCDCRKQASEDLRLIDKWAQIQKADDIFVLDEVAGTLVDLLKSHQLAYPPSCQSLEQFHLSYLTK